MTEEKPVTLRKGDFDAPEDERLETTLDGTPTVQMVWDRVDFELNRPGTSLVTVHTDLEDPETLER
jgi:hypothetical protein